jgi:RHS repeat-associated protein
MIINKFTNNVVYCKNGNVMVVITDRKIAHLVGTDVYWLPEVKTVQDFYPFGAPMPERSFNSQNYRYGFNAKENDNEVKGIGNQQDYGMRIYDPRLGRFLSVDPLFKDFAFYTPYQFSGNKPIWKIDLDGLEEADPPKNDGKTQLEVASKSELNFTAGFQFTFGWNGLKIDFSPAKFNILKIGITENIDTKTGKTSSEYNFDWFTGDVENSAGIELPILGKFSAANKFKVDSELNQIPATQQTEYSYKTPETTVNGVPVKGQVTYVEKSTGEKEVKTGASSGKGFSLILGYDFKTEVNVKGSKK